VNIHLLKVRAKIKKLYILINYHILVGFFTKTKLYRTYIQVLLLLLLLLLLYCKGYFCKQFKNAVNRVNSIFSSLLIVSVATRSVDAHMYHRAKLTVYDRAVEKNWISRAVVGCVVIVLIVDVIELDEIYSDCIYTQF
jgi:hypothetical protein